MMRIGFDAKRAAQNRTGLGNYSRFVIRGLMESFPDNQYVAYVPNERRMQYFDEIPSRDKITSSIEGFGIPMLEAITSGLPAIGCTGSCLEEAGGPTSLYVNPDDVEGMADAIHSVYNNVSLRQNMIAQGKEYARRFDIAKLTSDLYEVYQTVCGSHRGVGPNSLL